MQPQVKNKGYFVTTTFWVGRPSIAPVAPRVATAVSGTANVVGKLVTEVGALVLAVAVIGHIHGDVLIHACKGQIHNTLRHNTTQCNDT